MSNVKTVALDFSCWLCKSEELEIIKHSDLTREDVSSNSFAITDNAYGRTFEIHCCKTCGFMQCSNVKEVLSFYEQLQDQSYEETRKPRGLQMKKILELIKKYKSNCRLLDVGAGSGILVEQAIDMGYEAEGIEPSKWLAEKAHDRGLPVYEGALSNFKPKYLYDVVTVVDVIEHVTRPLDLLSNVYNLVSNDGIVVIVTPDIGSSVAKLLGWKWWHYRIAHIGYFNKNTLNFALNNSGFKLLKMYSPSWYFPLEYLLERINKYLPVSFPLRLPNFAKNMVLQVNLGDSILGIYTLAKTK